ncbi:MAG: hypothetical protein M0Z33_11490 [Actinomycetota bacterium]|nr:hypothetical protein [Actinomycetota bacterium]
MADLEVDGDEVVLRLSIGERAVSLHGELRAPLSALRRVEVLEDAHEPADHGWKVGERLPGVVEVGTILDEGRKIFAAVHRATPRGLLLEFEGADFDEWVVGCADPEATRDRLPAVG